jgi:hypothetical protein
MSWDLKMIFAKNQKLVLLPLKCKLTPVQQNRQQLTQNPKYTSEGFHNETRADMRILGGLLFMWGIVHSFQFRVLVAASHKKNLISTL